MDRQAANSVFRSVAFKTLAAIRRINELKCVQLEQERWHLDIRMKEVSNAYYLRRFRLEWELEKKLTLEQMAAELGSRIDSSHIDQAALEAALMGVPTCVIPGLPHDDSSHPGSEIEAARLKIAIEAARLKIAALETETANSEHQRTECDGVIKATEQRLIGAQEVGVYIMLLQSKYSFLRDDDI